MFYSKIFILVFLFYNFVECFEANLYPNLTLIDALERVHHFNEKLVSKIVQELDLDPNGKLHEILPEVQSIANASLSKLAKCYDNTVGDEELDIFHQPLGVIVHKFFKSFSHLLENKDLNETNERVKALLDSVRYIGKRVIECAFNEDPDYDETKLGLTSLSAYTDEEFNGIYLSNSNPQTTHGEIKLGAIRIEDFPSCHIDKIPSKVYKHHKFDWREKDVVTPVQSQGGCGSCYIFSSVGALESAYLLSGHSNHYKFSEKSFLDCSAKGCGGGNPSEIFQRAIDYGVSLEKDGRKYNEKKETCHNDHRHTKATGYCMNADLENDNELKAVIANYGPAVVAIVASHPDFKHLHGKWNHHCTKSKEKIKTDHYALAVGWDEKYWIIKNSWGVDWGVDGYLYLDRGVGQNCGVLAEVGVPFIK